MDSQWFDRLKEAIEGDGRSLRRLGRDAGLSENYVQQMLKDGKKPGMERLTSLLEALGQATAIYVLTGFRLDPQDLELLRVTSRLDPAARQDALNLLRHMASTQGEQGPAPAGSETTSSKAEASQ